MTVYELIGKLEQSHSDVPVRNEFGIELDGYLDVERDCVMLSFGQHSGASEPAVKAAPNNALNTDKGSGEIQLSMEVGDVQK